MTYLSSLNTAVSNLPTRRKIMLAVAVPLGFTVVVGLVAIIKMMQMKTTQDWVDHTQRVLGETSGIVAAAVDMETGMRGFLLAGQDTFLEPYEAGAARAFADLAELRQTVSDNPPQVVRLQEAEEILAEWQTQVAEPQIALRRAVGETRTMDDMADLVGEARGKTYFDAFRAIMSDFAGIEEALMVERQAANDAARVWTKAMIAAAVLVSLVLGGLIAMRIGNDIGLAVRKLTDAMGRLADGDNETFVEGQDRRDEVGEMARATDVFKQNAQRIAAMNEEREADARKMAEMAEAREAAATQEAELAKERELADREARARLDAMMAELDTVVDGALDGAFDRRLPAAFADASLDGLAAKVNRLLEVVDTGLCETGAVLGRVASGDLRQDMEGDFRGAFAQLQRDVNGMIAALRTLIGEIGAGSSSVSSSASELSGTAAELSKQTERNAASLEETSAAVEEISASVKQISTNVADSSANARHARETAQSNESVASEAVSSMERISEASQDISRVVSVIENIAFQINLLALNAGVEAARAGEAGRGFSVVASEVRALAQRSGEAASEITDVIARSDVAVSEGVEKVSAAKASLDEIAGIVFKIAGSIDDASTMISEQSTGIAEISTAISQLDGATQRQAAAFEEITASSAVLAGQAETMRGSIGQFRTSETVEPQATHLKYAS